MIETEGSTWLEPRRQLLDTSHMHRSAPLHPTERVRGQRGRDVTVPAR